MDKDAMFEKADEIVTDVMKKMDDVDENMFLATMGLLIKTYSVEKKADIAELVSKLFVSIAMTEGDLSRMESGKD